MAQIMHKATVSYTKMVMSIIPGGNAKLPALVSLTQVYGIITCPKDNEIKLFMRCQFTF